MNYLGQDSSGDFDQLSLDGVDFGANLTKDYNIAPVNLTAEDAMYGDDSQQLGNYDAQQLGLIPQGLGHSDSQQLGTFEAQQLGLIPEGLGGFGEIPDFNGLPGPGLPPQGLPTYQSPNMGQYDFMQAKVMGMPVWMVAAAAAAGAWFFMQKK